MTDDVRLTYAFRTGALAGVAGTRLIQLSARVTPSHVAAWEKQQALRIAQWTPSDHTFDAPQGPDSPARVLRLSQVASRPASSQCTAVRTGPALFVDDRAGGSFIHGWPPCGCARCILLPHGIEDLVRAVRTGGTLTIVG